VQLPAKVAGTSIASVRGGTRMNLYTAGIDLVRSELIALGPEGPYRLTVNYGKGSIVEYFHHVNAALAREAEIEQLMRAARGVPVGKGVAA